MPTSRPLPWVVRVLWAALPFTTGTVLAHAMSSWSAAPRDVASVGLWLGWAGVLVGTLVPRPSGLTALRVAAPAVLGAVVAALVTHHSGVASRVLAPAWAVATSAVALAPETAVVFVNGTAYPDERRFPLRAPGPLLLGPLPLAWAIVAGGAAAGPLLLADRRWVPGAVALLLLPASAVLARSLHELARRWVVFVPAGVVLHDPLALADPVLFRRQLVEALGPAPATAGDALDITQRALGLALELRLRDDHELAVARPRARGRRSETVHARRLLFTPTRPGAVVAEARARGYAAP